MSTILGRFRRGGPFMIGVTLPSPLSKDESVCAELVGPHDAVLLTVSFNQIQNPDNGEQYLLSGVIPDDVPYGTYLVRKLEIKNTATSESKLIEVTGGIIVPDPSLDK